MHNQITLPHLPEASFKAENRPTAILVLQSAALSIFIFLVASICIALSRFDGGAAFIWPATAPLLAYIAIRPPRDWLLPMVASGVAFWLASAIFGLGPITGIPLALASLSEAFVAAFLLRRVRRDFASFDSLPSLGFFVIVAGFVAPALSGVIASLAITASTSQAFSVNLPAWVTAHGLGTITFAPLILLFFEGEGQLWARTAAKWRKIEAAVLLIIVALTSFLVFYQARMPLLFLPLLPTLLTAFRLGRLGAASSVVLLAVIGGVFTLKGHGPVSLMHISPGDRAQFFQFYLAVTVLTVLPAAVELKQRRALMRRSRESEASYRLLAENLGDTIIHTDLIGTIRYVSPAIIELTGYNVEDVIGRNSSDFIFRDDLARVELRRAEAISDNESTISLEYRIHSKAGDIIWCDTKMRSYLDVDDDPAGLILVVRNASARKVTENQLNWEATTDELTGLPNRRAFFRRLDHIRGQADAGKSVAFLALLDIDFFKRVNDVHGHAAGDSVLKAIAETAKNSIRSSDMIARVGGEEFGLVLSATNLEQATATCERVRAAIAACTVQTATGHTILVTASLGLTLIKMGGSREEICGRADDLLYQAKSNGRDRVLVEA
jgi:diguanylate cyclase (GGDEF)-like protein/PAS domain S-box-containing protein